MVEEETSDARWSWLVRLSASGCDNIGSLSLKMESAFGSKGEGVAEAMIVAIVSCLPDAYVSILETT